MNDIQDVDTLAYQLYAKDVIDYNNWGIIEGCPSSKEKKRVLTAVIQQQVSVNSGNYRSFIDVLEMDKSNDAFGARLTGKEGPRFGNMASQLPYIFMYRYIGKDRRVCTHN